VSSRTREVESEGRRYDSEEALIAVAYFEDQASQDL
jgi:hypothetical protein